MDEDFYERAAYLSRLHLFMGLDEQSLITIASLFKEQWFDPGTVIYKQGSRDSRLYILHTGSVKLLQIPDGNNIEEIRSVLEGDDVFGFESVDGSPKRLLTAVAIKGSSILFIDQKSLTDVLDQFSLVARRLKQLSDSYQLWVYTALPWTTPEETVVYITRRHPVFLWIGLFGPAFLLGLLLLPLLALYYLTGYTNNLILIIGGAAAAFCLGWAVWRAIDWSNDYYIITRRRIVFQERLLLLYDARQEVPLEAIISNSILTSYLGRIFGYGNVTIRSFIGTLDLIQIASPEYVLSVIDWQRRRSQSTQRKVEYETMKQFWRKTRTPEKEKPTIVQSAKNKSPSAQYTPGLIQISLANILHLNVEQNGNLIFRTHWFILLKQIGPPSLAMLFVLALMIIRLLNWFEFISLGAFSALMILIGLVVAGWWLYQFIDWNNDLCIVTPEQVMDIDRTPLGSEEKRVAPLKAILSIDFERLGIIGLVLNYGSVNVRTGGDVLTIQHVYNPSEVAKMIFERYDRMKVRERLTEQEMGWHNTGEFIRAYEDVKQEGEIPSSGGDSG